MEMRDAALYIGEHIRTRQPSGTRPADDRRAFLEHDSSYIRSIVMKICKRWALDGKFLLKYGINTELSRSFWLR